MEAVWDNAPHERCGRALAERGEYALWRLAAMAVAGIAVDMSTLALEQKNGMAFSDGS